MIRIVADDNIPSLAHFLRGTGHLDLIPGRDICARHVREADVLLVRSVTRVDRTLLEGASVRFVGSATSGVDHVDVPYLRGRGIEFRHTPGANAESVVEYVLAALFALAHGEGSELRGRTVGIVGVGHVGGRLAARLEATGTRLVVNDPPREASVGDFAPGLEKADLATTVAESDVLTLHVPLEHGGDHPTRHLINGPLLESMKPGAWLINTSRGPVVDESALLRHTESPASGPVVLDVWDSEPTPDPVLVSRSRIGTPHVAGYSLDAKLTATRRIAAYVRRFLGLPEVESMADDFSRFVELPPPSLSESAWYHALIRQMLDLESESERFRLAMLESPDPGLTFALHRQEHMARRSFRRYAVRRADLPGRYAGVEDVLGVAVRPGP